ATRSLRMQRTPPPYVPVRLRLEDRRLLSAGVDPLALLGGRLPLHRDAHQAGHLENARATLGEVGFDDRAHHVERGSNIATVNADVLGDGAEDLALAARLGRDADLQRLGEVELRDGSDGPLLPVLL